MDDIHEEQTKRIKAHPNIITDSANFRVDFSQRDKGEPS